MIGVGKTKFSPPPPGPTFFEPGPAVKNANKIQIKQRKPCLARPGAAHFRPCRARPPPRLVGVRPRPSSSVRDRLRHRRRLLCLGSHSTSQPLFLPACLPSFFPPYSVFSFPLLCCELRLTPICCSLLLFFPLLTAFFHPPQRSFPTTQRASPASIPFQSAPVYSHMLTFQPLIHPE